MRQLPGAGRDEEEEILEASLTHCWWESNMGQPLWKTAGQFLRWLRQ